MSNFRSRGQHIRQLTDFIIRLVNVGVNFDESSFRFLEIGRTPAAVDEMVAEVVPVHGRETAGAIPGHGRQPGRILRGKHIMLLLVIRQ